MEIVTCLQSCPLQEHFATHVVRPTASRPDELPSSHTRYSPTIPHSDVFVVCLTLTVKWDFEQVRWRPMILTEEEYFALSGWRILMVSPGLQHTPCGRGTHWLVVCENVYMCVSSRARHVLLLASTSCRATSVLTAGSNSGGVRTKNNHVVGA